MLLHPPSHLLFKNPLRKLLFSLTPYQKSLRHKQVRGAVRLLSSRVETQAVSPESNLSLCPGSPWDSKAGVGVTGMVMEASNGEPFIAKQLICHTYLGS